MTPTNYQYTIDRFYQHLGESVLFFPLNSNYKLNTFVSILSEADLAPENLSKDERDTRTNSFVSKKYLKKQGSISDYDFPVLAAIQLDGVMMEVFDQQHPKRLRNKIQLSILEPFVDSKDETKTRTDRSVQEIWRDTSSALSVVLNYISKLEFAKVVPLSGPTVYGYYNPAYLAYLLSQAKITSYESNVGNLTRGTISLKENLKTLNENIEYFNIGPISGKNLYGTTAIIQFDTLDCDLPTFDFAFAENNFIYGNSCI